MAIETTPRSVTLDDTAYPVSIRALEHPPQRLWYIGDLSLASHVPTVAIVGTRHCTPYGSRTAREIAGAFGRAGACVVSGMALGIDAVAHAATLEAGGRTVAVLGSGVDRAYPPSNRALYRDIAARGLLLSEFEPGTRPFKSHFPQRNRIIAAMAKVTIVVEAGLLSGTSSTADAANKLGRDLAAVPGPIDAPTSQGANQLIKDANAQIITCVDDALSLVGLSRPAPAVVRLENAAQRRVWEALSSPAATLDDLCARAALPARDCLEAVTRLELAGAVDCELTGHIRRRA